ncbi:MAG TPA: hypothetical protein VFW73_07100 [Lacipirellulaceae bacterium]|nr:hypothetical protein [Lacipirellulaceae bacterium]
MSISTWLEAAANFTPWTTGGIILYITQRNLIVQNVVTRVPCACLPVTAANPTNCAAIWSFSEHRE